MSNNNKSNNGMVVPEARAAMDASSLQSATPPIPSRILSQMPKKSILSGCKARSRLASAEPLPHPCGL